MPGPPEPRDESSRFSAVAASVQDALIAADASSRIIFWSRSAERIFGWPAAEALGAPLTSLMPERFRDAHRAGIERVVAGGERHVLGGPAVELVGLRADGTEFPIELTLGAWQDEIDGPCFTGVVRDVSERAYARRVLGTQYEVAAALARSQGLDEGLVRALEAVGRGMGWRAGHLWIAVDGVLTCRSAWHEPGELDAFAAASRAMTFAPGEGLPGRVWTSGRAAWLPDVLEDANFPRLALARDAGLHAAVGLPLVADGETRGVAEFFATELRAEDEAQLDVLQTLGSQLGQFLLRREAEAALGERERLEAQAAELNDEVVQGLVLAGYHLDRGEAALANTAIGLTLEAAKRMVTELLSDAAVEAGALRRSRAARVSVGE